VNTPSSNPASPDGTLPPAGHPVSQRQVRFTLAEAIDDMRYRTEKRFAGLGIEFHDR
jgi:hypothetical protein